MGRRSRVDDLTRSCKNCKHNKLEYWEHRRLHIEHITDHKSAGSSELYIMYKSPSSTACELDNHEITNPYIAQSCCSPVDSIINSDLND